MGNITHITINYAELMPEDADIRYEFDEIAGYHEYCNNLSRPESEFLAYLELKMKHATVKTPIFTGAK